MQMLIHILSPTPTVQLAPLENNDGVWCISRGVVGALASLFPNRVVSYSITCNAA